VSTLEVIYSHLNGNKGDVKDTVDDIMKKIDCNNDGSISVYEWIEQGKAIRLLDPLTSGSSKKKKKGQAVSTLPQTFTSNYKMDKLLGSGAFARVFNVVNVATGVEFAAKIVDKAKTPKEHYFMIETEIEVFKRCGHDNVVKMVDYFETPKEWIMVLEKVTGGELLDRISERDRYREEDARKAIRETLMAVEHLHDRGVVHRDIKPENLLLLNDKDDAPIKLADFGTAHVLKDESEDGKLRLRCGTPVYAAPEMIEILINVGERRGYGRKVDLWGVGIIMFSILGGYPPFWAEEDEETYQKILQGDPGYIPEYWNPVSHEAKDLLAKLFTVDPNKRPSANECLKHAWFKADMSSGGDLSKAQKRMLARRRWHRAINAIRSTVRMRLLFKGNDHELRITSSDLGKGKGKGAK
jgi:serine/threonine protein kinase